MKFQFAKYKWIILSSLLSFSILIVIVLNEMFTQPMVYKKIEIDIQSNLEIKFTTPNDFLKILKKYDIKAHEPINEDILIKVEHEALQNKYVEKVKAYISNKNVFYLKITEVNPIARIFLKNGSSFYINDNYKLIPIKNSVPMRLPIYSNTPIFKKNYKVDTNVIKNILYLNNIITKSTFWNPLISEIEFYQDSNILIYLNLGNQVLNFGNLMNAPHKFNIAENFLRQTWKQRGLNYYKYINFTFEHEVFASISSEKIIEKKNMIVSPIQTADSINNNLDVKNEPNPLRDSKTIPVLELNNKNVVKKNTNLNTNIKKQTLNYKVADSKLNEKSNLQPKALFKKQPQKKH